MSDRTVFTDALETLGTIISPNEKRDAIHLAVEPIIAGEDLCAGEDVGIKNDGKAYNKTDKWIGIVDPFIKGYIKTGQRFWLVIYPREITSLRHVWTHPDLPNYEPVILDNKIISEKWLQNFAIEKQIEYSKLIIAALNSSYDEEYLTISDEVVNGGIPEEFWIHVENVTNKIIPKEYRAKYFNCAC